ncbi:MAG: pseudouridine-5'-phosphate glycosidase [Chloroflexota bacterium]
MLSHLHISPTVNQALKTRKAVVALESTVITHGLPYPENHQLAQDMEAQVLAHGATPATVAVLDGQIHVGLESGQLARLARPADMRKISVRDFAPAIAQKASGGTTVAGTLLAAHAAGIQVFATGGIGGVHRQAPFDVSADLPQLARTPCVVVCAGAKSILDLPATLEMLETLGVPVIGYQSDDFPAFYSRSSGLKTSARAETPQEIATMAQAHWGLGLKGAVLVANPPPAATALPWEEVERVVLQALSEAQAQAIHGQAVTPFLLGRVSQLTHGASLHANLALLLDNARLAAEIAGHLAPAVHPAAG